MVTNLNDAQSSLRHLVELANAGEVIVITVDGQPAAQLTGTVTPETNSIDRKRWAEELFTAAQAARVGDCQSTPQSFWDEMREERV